MLNSFVTGTIILCIQTSIYDATAECCKGLVKRYKRKKFINTISKQIRDFYKNNTNSFIDGDIFHRYIKNYKPFDKLMKNALSMGESMSYEELINNIVEDATVATKSDTYKMSMSDRMLLRDLCVLIYKNIMYYYESILTEEQKYIISKNAQNTRVLQDMINNKEKDIKDQIETVRQIVIDTNSINADIAEKILDMICGMMWEGRFDEVKNIYNIISNKSEDVEKSIDILMALMFKDDVEINNIICKISKIKNFTIRNILIRNIIPLMYYRQMKFSDLVKYTDSEILITIMSALDNEDYSDLFNEEVEISKGIEVRNYNFNCSLMEAEKWLYNLVFSIYLYNMKHVNVTSVIEKTIKTSESWFSLLIIYEKKLDMIAYSNINDINETELNEIEDNLKSKRELFDQLSSDLKAAFYALVMKCNMIYTKSDLGEIVDSIPKDVRDIRPVSDFLFARLIDEKNISFEEVYDYCKKNDVYWLINKYIISARDNENKLIEEVNKHREILEKSEKIFFVFLEKLRHSHKENAILSELIGYKERYGKFFEYWDIYMSIDLSVKEEFLKLCKNDQIVYCSGTSGYNLVERLIGFEEYELAELYNNRLEIQRINLKISKKYKAYILAGKNRNIDALELFKEIFVDFPKDGGVLKSIISISINLNRPIEDIYIEAAKKSNEPSLLVLAGGAYVANGNIVEARRCNMKALFLSDDCRNPAFNQYLGLFLVDMKKEYTVTKIEKNTVAILQNDSHIIRYCIHEDEDLSSSPCVWHEDIHLYFNDAAKLGIYGRHVGDEVIIEGKKYKIIKIEALDAYISRICFESAVKNGSAKAITANYINGKMDMESICKQIVDITPDSEKQIDWIKQYNNFEDIAYPLYALKNNYNTTYTTFVEIILDEKKSCIREIENNNIPKSNRFILTFTSMIIMKKIGITPDFLRKQNVYIPESMAMQVKKDTSETIERFSQNKTSSLGVAGGRPYFIEADDTIKEKMVKMSGEISEFTNSISTLACRKDLNSSLLNQMEMIKIFGIPDYDAISIGVNDGYTIISTEAMITNIAITDAKMADTVSITNWLVSTSMDVFKLMYFVEKLVDLGCVFAVTENLVIYLADTFEAADDLLANKILSEWDSLLKKYETIDETIKPYGIEMLRRIYLSASEKLNKPLLNRVLFVFSKRILLLYGISIQINDNNEIE